MCFGYGMKDSGRVESMFGIVAGNHGNNNNNNNSRHRGGSGNVIGCGIDCDGVDCGLGLGFESCSFSGIDGNDAGSIDWKNHIANESIGMNLGLLGIIVSKLMGFDHDNKGSVETNNGEGSRNNEDLKNKRKEGGGGVRFTLSIIEIAGEDVLRDFLIPTSSSPSVKLNGYNSGGSDSMRNAFKSLSSPLKQNNPLKLLKIRHSYTKGVIVQTIKEKIESISELETLIKRAFHSKSVCGIITNIVSLILL